MPINSADWRPTASRQLLRQRAELLAGIRAFFQARDVLEVETPLLSHCGAMDAQINSFVVDTLSGRRMYLQSSPEYAMKRLLAAGSGAVFQLCKAFRDDEQGSLHNPEFTMLEWYRPEFDSAQLIDEVLELLRLVLGERDVVILNYVDSFQQHTGLDPLSANRSSLEDAAVQRGLDVETCKACGRDCLLDYLFSAVVQPQFRALGIVVLREYPAAQAALARLLPERDNLADRFEVFVDGLELANGYGELLDAQELSRRFAGEAAQRRQNGLAPMPVDVRLLAAMESGLPQCSGVALGVDRLLMLATGCDDLRQVLAFPSSRA